MVCPVCKHDNSDDVSFCANCNTYLCNPSHKENDNLNRESNNNSNNSINSINSTYNLNTEVKNERKKKTNSVFSIISIMCSVIGIIGIISVVQVINLVQLILTPLIKDKDIFFSTYFHFNGVFIIFSFLAWMFGKMHKNRYNERCTGYIIGVVLVILYLIEFLVMLGMYSFC